MPNCDWFGAAQTAVTFGTAKKSKATKKPARGWRYLLKALFQP